MTITTPRTMTDQERMALVDHHAAVEFAQDWDAAWDTLDEEGSYDYFPLGIRVSGRENLQEHWRRLFAVPELKDIAETTLSRFIRGEDVVLVTQAPVRFPDGQVRMSVSTALFTFRGDKVLRESVFADDILQPLIERILDEEFRSRPGVSAIPTF
ncbi:hypothetical protein [Ornithinimicrobium faecis]|uniref:SnoaL-like domain-containing protein n=1 Tax=Ornithinimicrobium faecis TaxID=2934158 RepID=A0ABY4YZ21_9MICO|nr:MULTISPECIES: hypothetical protein [unclassified Ornithinimicrobium]USQ81891.1 hypothetical protein NF556_09710 [Ornithinimicrobium sp. HY1793]